jgi:quaternary ammonium compound-resistance protein SugE
MSWIYLFLAGLSEIGWPVGLKMMQQNAPMFKTMGFYIGLFIAASFIGLSGLFLVLAQREIPIGTAYAVWVAIGAVGTFAVGAYFYGDPVSLFKFLGVALIVFGVIMMKIG